MKEVVKQWWHRVKDPVAIEVRCTRCGGWGCPSCKQQGWHLEVNVLAIVFRLMPIAVLMWVAILAAWVMTPS